MWISLRDRSRGRKDRSRSKKKIFDPRAVISGTMNPACGKPSDTKLRYEANLPIMVLAFQDNLDAAIPIAAGDVFEVVRRDEDDRFVVVDIRGQEFLIFESDLEHDSKLVV
jgi:hypothetical protein